VFALAIAIKDNEPDLTHLPSTLSPFIKNIILELLKKNPKDRPTAQ
jgi:hypothetical protein